MTDRERIAEAVQAALAALADLPIDDKRTAQALIVADIEREAHSHLSAEDEKRTLN